MFVGAVWAMVEEEDRELSEEEKKKIEKKKEETQWLARRVAKLLEDKYAHLDQEREEKEMFVKEVEVRNC